MDTNIENVTENLSNNPSNETKQKKEKKPIPKSAKILIGLMGVVVVLFAMFLIFIFPRIRENIAQKKAYQELIDVDYSYEDDLNNIDDTAIDIYKQLIVGRYVAKSNDADVTGAMIFDFRDDGTFFGHTAREEDDLGKWTLESNNGTMVLITSVPDLMERYEINFNNNNDITLTCTDESVLILSKILTDE